MTGDTGRFLLLGSGEFEPWAAEAERFALDDASGDGSVAVFATASAPESDAVFERWISMGVDHYDALGITAHAVRVRTRIDALDTDMAKVLDDVSMVFFSGGSPKYLAATLSGTPVWDALSGWWIRWLRDLASRRVPDHVRFIGIAEHTAIASEADDWRVFGAGEVDVRYGRKRQTFLAGQRFAR